MGVREMDRFLEQWELGSKDVHRRLILAPTPRDVSGAEISHHWGGVIVYH